MAKMHSKKRGKSGSKRPPTKIVPDWVEYSKTEVEELVAKMAKEGVSSAKIGQKLRDTYGIPSVKNITGKSITEMMKASGAKMEYPEDLLNLITKAVRMRKHLEANGSDVHNKTKLLHVESKIKRLARYYVRSGKLPVGWSYDPDKAALLVK
ncbi:MAG: 30S ribosomal protein S15 [Candidatus Micrarchaeota archaeon]